MNLGTRLGTELGTGPDSVLGTELRTELRSNLDTVLDTGLGAVFGTELRQSAMLWINLEIECIFTGIELTTSEQSNVVSPLDNPI